MKNTNIYAVYRYLPQIISHAVWFYHRFILGFRDMEELLAVRGISVSYETIRNWCHKFGQRYCSQIRKDRGNVDCQLKSHTVGENFKH
jgi:putative transposase